MRLGSSWCFIFWLCMELSLVADMLEANTAHQILSNKSNEERNAVLTVLLFENKEDCDLVVKNFFQGFEPQGGAFWNVTCENGKSYIILIENDARGSTRVMDCAVVKSLTKGRNECFKKLK